MTGLLCSEPARPLYGACRAGRALEAMLMLPALREDHAPTWELSVHPNSQVTSFQSMAGGWHFSQGLLSPEVATEGLPSLPPAPLPGAALGEAAYPLGLLKGSARETGQCFC